MYNANINYRPVPTGTTRAISAAAETNLSNGAFYPAMALDSSLDFLYVDYSSGTSYIVKRYGNLKSGLVTRVNLTNALLTNSPTALKVSPYTTASTTLLIGTRNSKLLKVTNANLATGSQVWTDITGPAFVGSVSDVEFGATENEIL